MPDDLHFKSEEAYRKSNAYRHIHGIPAPKRKTVTIRGRKRKVKHSALSKRGGK